MKVYVNRSVVNGPWGGGNMFVKAFRKFAPDNGVELLKPDEMKTAPDVILLVGIGDDGFDASMERCIMYKLHAATSFNKDVKLVMRVNENDARKATQDVDDYLLKLSKYVDATVFVSDWLRDYFTEKGWSTQPQHQHVIINGVDRDVFKPQPKLDNGKMNIVAHHWSDNPLKGFDIYDQLDKFVGENSEKYSFTYIGRHRNSFEHAKTVRPLYGTALGEELGKHDVYVSASRFDPGPNHILEALACNLPVYVHKDGGG